MSVVVTLEVDGRVVVVADPSGGDCNAAGDFDRLLPFAATFTMLSRIDPNDEVQFNASEMADISLEAERALALAVDDRERRGLLRLRALAAHGGTVPDSTLRVVGD
jgi:hypothetical protein